MHGLKFDRRRLRTRRRGVGHIDARHPGAVEHQPLCTLGAGRAPEGVALNSAHRRGVGFDLHQAHPRAARHALHHAPRYQARTWNALAGDAVKRLQRIARQCGRGATNCDDFGALRRRLVAPCIRRDVRITGRTATSDGRHARGWRGHCTCIAHRQACKAAQADWQAASSWRALHACAWSHRIGLISKRVD
jgi:hypothetical protein